MKEKRRVEDERAAPFSGLRDRRRRGDISQLGDEQPAATTACSDYRFTARQIDDERGPTCCYTRYIVPPTFWDDQAIDNGGLGRDNGMS